MRALCLRLCCGLVVALLGSLWLPGEAAAQADYDEALSRIEADYASERNRATRLATSWPTWERVANLAMSRARLTGNYPDYLAAEAHLATAFALAGEAGGPHMARARLNFTLHRLEPVASDLAAVEGGVIVSDPVRAAVLTLRADVAFHRGDFDAARTGYEQALALRRTPETLFGAAHLRWMAGDFEAAEALIQEAGGLAVASNHLYRAWLTLQLGIMDLGRGRLDEALAHYQAADALLPGWWLVEEHIAEIMSLRGDHPGAIARYYDLIARTGDPEFMGALADSLRAVGDDAAADLWVDLARRSFEARLVLFPEATYGHALGFFLENAPDDPETLRVAEANFALRPGGEARILLAEALLAHGRASEAEGVLAPLLAGVAFRTADLHAVAARVYEATGRQSDAEGQRAAALAMNPLIFE